MTEETLSIMDVLRSVELFHARAAMPRHALRRDGTSQDERFPRELGGDYFRIDEREMEDLLSLTLHLAGLIRFQDGADGDRLDWRVFFRKDISVVLARVVRYGRAAWEAQAMDRMGRVQRHLHSLYQQESPDFTSEAQAAFQELISWVREGSSELRSPLQAIQRWKAKLPLGHAFAPEVEAAVITVVDQQIKQLDDAERLVLGSYTTRLDLANAADKAADILARSIRALSEESARLQASARRHFAHSLTDFPEHSPHAGLFIGFLQLLRVAQGRLNELGPAQLDFYFKEVLRFAPSAAEADHAYLVATLGPGASKVLIPKDSRFLTADKRVYAATQDWVLNPGTLSQTLGLRRGQGLKALGEGGTEDGHWPGMAGIGVTGPAQLGWAVGSRMLHLAQGRRTIWVGMALQAGGKRPGKDWIKEMRDQVMAGLKVRVTTAKGWRDLPLSSASWYAAGVQALDHWMPDSFKNSDHMVLGVVAAADFPPIVAYDPAVHGPGWESRLPLIQFTWAMQGKDSIEPILEDMKVREWHVVVAVGDRRPRVATDDGEQDASKPFAPFGQQPALRNRWMVDVNEALAKFPDQMMLSWHWVPTLERDLGLYFKAYFDQVAGGVPSDWRDAFTARLTFQHQLAETLSLEDTELFGPGDDIRRLLKFERIPTEEALKLPEKAAAERPDGVGPIQEGHYLQLSLGGPIFAFGHQNYTPLTTKAHLEQHHAQVVALQKPNGTAPSLDLSKFPNPPLTPMIADVRLSYRAGAGTTTLANNGSVEVFHQGPFGVARVDLGKESVPLLPQFPGSAYLFLGLEGLVAPSLLSLLIQVQAGTGDTEWALPDVTWRYLAGDAWQDFKGSELVADGSHGLRQSGIVQLSIPVAANAAHGLMPDGLVWLSAEIVGNAAALDRIAGIHLQAIDVALADVGTHSGSVLAAGSLTKSATYINGLKEVRQPYPGHGGAAIPSPQQFQSKVSERLRHKGKSISAWDYERIVLQAFPEVDRVKCIPNTRPGNPGAPLGSMERLDHELSPGHVTIVCIPDTRHLQLSNPLQPRCRRELLATVQDCLQAQVPPFATVHVANPDYVAVSVNCKVAFMPGVDAGLGITWLEEAIAKFLCPWAFDAGTEMTFGGKVHANQILYLIEQQPYVDVVAGLSLSRVGEDKPSEEVECSSSRQVLVAAQIHGIRAVAVEEIEGEGSEIYGGISWWRINEDFIVNGN